MMMVAPSSGQSSHGLAIGNHSQLQRKGDRNSKLVRHTLKIKSINHNAIHYFCLLIFTNTLEGFKISTSGTSYTHSELTGSNTFQVSICIN